MRVTIMHSLKRKPNTYRNFQFISTESIVVVQGENTRPWMYETIIGHKTDDHNGRGYRVQVTKRGCAITRMKRDLKPTNILAEDYIQNQITKANQTLAADTLNELTDQFMQILEDHQFNKNEDEDNNNISKDNTRSISHKGQLNANVYTEKTDILRQIRNCTCDKCECYIKTQN